MAKANRSVCGFGRARPAFRWRFRRPCRPYRGRSGRYVLGQRGLVQWHELVRGRVAVGGLDFRKRGLHDRGPVHADRLDQFAARNLQPAQRHAIPDRFRDLRRRLFRLRRQLIYHPVGRAACRHKGTLGAGSLGCHADVLSSRGGGGVGKRRREELRRADKPLQLGADTDFGQFFAGEIDRLGVTRAARYTAPFNPAGKL